MKTLKLWNSRFRKGAFAADLIGKEEQDRSDLRRIPIGDINRRVNVKLVGILSSQNAFKSK